MYKKIWTIQRDYLKIIEISFIVSKTDRKMKVNKVKKNYHKYLTQLICWSMMIIHLIIQLLKIYLINNLIIKNKFNSGNHLQNQKCHRFPNIWLIMRKNNLNLIKKIKWEKTIIIIILDRKVISK